MEPIGFLLGIATFQAAVRFKQPLRKFAVSTASQIIIAADKFRTTAYSLKEEIEDIVAEAHYENTKNNFTNMEENNKT